MVEGKPPGGVKVRPGHRRDFTAYLRWWREWPDPFGHAITPALPRGGRDALAAFVSLESSGVAPAAVRHPRVFRAVVEGKALLNWQIKQWAWQVRDAARLAAHVAVSTLFDLRHDFPWLPEWVWDAVRQQSGLEAMWKADKAAV